MISHQVLAILATIAATANCAAIPVPVEVANSRQPRTLGLLTAGTNVLTTGLGAAGSAAATAIGVTSAVKPLVFLGLGKCEYDVLFLGVR